MPITMLYFKLSSMLMFDVYNNTAPHNISHLFIPTQQIHSYSTRSSSSGNYYISHSRLNQYCNSWKFENTLCLIAHNKSSKRSEKILTGYWRV